MNNYKTEEEFLNEYNPKDYPSFAVATDILVFGISSVDDEDYKNLDNKKMSLLLVNRDTHPFINKWCLPGGFVKIDEELEDAPKRILKDETGLTDIYLEQLYTFGGVKRDPRMRVVTSSYMSLIDKDKIKNIIKDNASWFDIVEHKENKNEVMIKLSNGIEQIDFTIEKHLRELTTDRYSFTVKND